VSRSARGSGGGGGGAVGGRGDDVTGGRDHRSSGRPVVSSSRVVAVLSGLSRRRSQRPDDSTLTRGRVARVSV